MAISRIEQLRQAFKTPERQQTEGSFGEYYPFWNMKTGEQCIVRFLPDANPDNPLGFLVEKIMHTLYIDGQKKSIPCMAMYGEPCDICKVSQDFYKAGDKINGKKYWKNRQHIAQVQVISDPLEPNKETGENHEGKVHKITLTFQIFNVIKEAFESGELDDDPSSFEGGYDFVIKKTQQGDHAAYVVGTKFKSKARSLEDEEIAFVKEHMIDLSTMLPKKPEAIKVRAMLDAALTGKSVDEDEDEEGDGGFENSPTNSEQSKPVTTEEKPPLVQESTPPKTATVSEVEDEADQIIADIQRRRAAKAAKSA